MTQELDISTREKLEKALESVIQAQNTMRVLLNTVQHWELQSTSSSSQEKETELHSMLENLRKENSELTKSLQSAQADAQRNKNELHRFRKEVVDVLRQSFHSTFKQLGLSDPLRSAERDLDVLQQEAKGLKQQIARQETEKVAALKEVDSLQAANEVLGTRLNEQTGLAERYNGQIKELQLKFDELPSALEKRMFSELLTKVWMRYHTAICAQIKEDGLSTSEEELAEIGTRLLGHFKQAGLMPLHEPHSKVEGKNVDPSLFELDEEQLERAAMYEVVTPGAALKGMTLIKSTIQRVKDRDDAE